ncbi:hypothetical protein TKK_0013796 [Trichogramma kaykai]
MRKSNPRSHQNVSTPPVTPKIRATHHSENDDYDVGQTGISLNDTGSGKMRFFQTLIPHVMEIKPEDELNFRNDIHNIIQVYVNPNSTDRNKRKTPATLSSTSMQETIDLVSSPKSQLPIPTKKENDQERENLKRDVKKQKRKISEMESKNQQQPKYNYTNFCKQPCMLDVNYTDPLTEQCTSQNHFYVNSSFSSSPECRYRGTCTPVNSSTCAVLTTLFLPSSPERRHRRAYSPMPLSTYAAMTSLISRSSLECSNPVATSTYNCLPPTLIARSTLAASATPSSSISRLSPAHHHRPAFTTINTPKNPDDLEKQTTKVREEDNSSETSDCGEVETMISAIAEQSRNNATELAEVKEALASMKDRHTALCEYVLDMKCDQRDIRKAVLDSLAILKLQETRVREVSPSPPPRRYDPDRINDLLSSTRFPLTENTSSQQSNNLSNTRISNIDSTLSGVRVRREYTLNSKITYADWLEHLKSELEHYDLIDFIDPEINLGDDPNVKKSRSIVQSLIISRVDKSYQSKLINIKDPHELLSKIKEIRKVENNLNVYSLKKDIYNITMKKNESANDFCNRFDNMLKLYDSCDPKDKFTEYDKAAAFYNATQERCTELRSLVKLRKLNHENELTIEEMKSCLLQDEIDKAAKVNPPPAARAVRTTKSGGEPSKCHRCEQKGHLAPECPLGPYKLWYCYGCKKITGHKTPACPNVQQRSVESDSNKTEIPNNERRKGGGKWAKGKNQNKKPYKKPKGSPSKTMKSRLHDFFSSVVARGILNPSDLIEIPFDGDCIPLGVFQRKN